MGGIGHGLWGSTLWGGPGGGPAPPSASYTVQAGILYPALRIAGVVMSPNRQFAQEIQNDSFEMYNTLLDEWGTQELLVWEYYRTVQNLVANQRLYKIGPKAIDATVDFDLVRPPRIEFASILVFTEPNGSTHPIRRPLQVLHVQDRASIGMDRTYSSIPLRLYYNMGWPIGLIDMWPIPNTSVNQLEMWVWRQLQAAATPADIIMLPPAYKKALQYNLALDIASRPWTVSKPMNAIAIETARTSKAWIKSLNQEVHQLTMRTESGCGSYGNHGEGRFDIFTGHFTLG